MAKLGGEQTELLQISGDERARAMRSALLFTEEEITRNLQIVLRTFDDLNYRQEQRFHLELGMIKLIHAQRLLPIEELLSGVATGGGTRTAPVPSAPRTAPAAPARSSTPAPAAPSISPFGTSGWGSGPCTKQSGAPSAVTEIGRSPEPMMHAEVSKAASAPMREPTPFTAVASQTVGFASSTMTEGALAMAPDPEPAKSTPTSTPEAVPAPASTSAPTVEALRHAIGMALVNAGHSSAAQLLGAATWVLESSSLRIEVPGVGKKMLSLTVNAAGEKIIRQELQRLGAPSRFMVVPGEGSAQAAPVAAPLAGSIQEAALAHPMVQKAKEIFNADVRSVVDLSQK
jgi:DNA polymerase-3 subunit gamma/tau